MTLPDSSTTSEEYVAAVSECRSHSFRRPGNSGRWIVPVSTSRHAVLSAIVKFGPLSMSELAAHEGVDPASVSRTVRKLEESGEVVRRTSDADGRVNLIEVTESGRELFLRSRRQLTEIILDRISTLSPEQMATIIALGDGLELLVSATGPRPS